MLTRWMGPALAAALASASISASGCGHHAGGLAAEAAAARDQMCKCDDRACAEAVAARGAALEQKLRATYKERQDVPAAIQAIGREYSGCRTALEARLGVGLGGAAHGLRGIRPGGLPARPGAPLPVRPVPPRPSPAPRAPAAPMPAAEVDDLRAQLRTLDEQLRAAQHDLDAATTDADRHAAQARIDALAANRQAVMQRARAAKRGAP